MIFNWGQYFNLLFKYLAGASTHVSEHKPRHMGAPQYQLNCPRHMHEPYIYVCTRGRLLGVECLHLLSSNACIFWARTPASLLRKSALLRLSNAYISYAQERT